MKKMREYEELKSEIHNDKIDVENYKAFQQKPKKIFLFISLLDLYRFIDGNDKSSNNCSNSQFF